MVRKARRILDVFEGFPWNFREDQGKERQGTPQENHGSEKVTLRMSERGVKFEEG